MVGGCERPTTEAATIDSPAAASSDASADAPADRSAGSPTVEPAAERTLVSVQPVVPEQVIDRTSLAADLLPWRRAVLAAEVAGTVESVAIDEGQAVRRGQLLLSVDVRSLEQRLAEAEAVDHQRRVQLEKAEKLLARQSITQSRFLDAQTQRDVAAAQLASARLELDKAQVQAPWAGTVSRRLVEVGDYVMPGQPVIELIDLSKIKVRAPAPATDVQFLRRGLAAEVRVDALPGEAFSGRLTHLAAELDAAARTLDVEVAIDNPERRLRPGMAARIDIARRQIDDAIVVPLTALIELADRQVVYVVEDGLAVQRSVVLGLLIEGRGAVVEQGLAAGDRLITEGQLRISPGQQVKSVAKGQRRATSSQNQSQSGD